MITIVNSIYIYIYIYIYTYSIYKYFPKERYCTPYLSLVPRNVNLKCKNNINTIWRNSI